MDLLSKSSDWRIVEESTQWEEETCQIKIELEKITSYFL